MAAIVPIVLVSSSAVVDLITQILLMRSRTEGTAFLFSANVWDVASKKPEDVFLSHQFFSQLPDVLD